MSSYPRIRVVCPDGLVHMSTVLVVAEDGSEMPITDRVTRIELVGDPEDGMWRAVLAVEAVELDVTVDDAEKRAAPGTHEKTEEN